MFNQNDQTTQSVYYKKIEATDRIECFILTDALSSYGFDFSMYLKSLGFATKIFVAFTQ